MRGCCKCHEGHQYTLAPVSEFKHVQSTNHSEPFSPSTKRLTKPPCIANSQFLFQGNVQLNRLSLIVYTVYSVYSVYSVHNKSCWSWRSCSINKQTYCYCFWVPSFQPDTKRSLWLTRTLSRLQWERSRDVDNRRSLSPCVVGMSRNLTNMNALNTSPNVPIRCKICLCSSLSHGKKRQGKHRLMRFGEPSPLIIAKLWNTHGIHDWLQSFRIWHPFSRP